jgi:hypothetical protein
MDNQPLDQLSENEVANQEDPKKRWIKRLGLGAFMFFLLKGILWLCVFFGLGKAIWG